MIGYGLRFQNLQEEGYEGFGQTLREKG